MTPFDVPQWTIIAADPVAYGSLLAALAGSFVVALLRLLSRLGEPL